MDVAEVFTELACTVMNAQADYYFLGPDTVDGVQTEHIRIEAAGDQIDVWLAEDETIVNGLVNDEEVSLEAVQIAVEFYFSMLEIFIGYQGWDEGWKDAEVSTVARDLGAGNIEVTRMDWNPTWLPYAIEIEIAEIAGKKMLIRFWQVTNSGQPVNSWYLRRAITRYGQGYSLATSAKTWRCCRRISASKPTLVGFFIAFYNFQKQCFKVGCNFCSKPCIINVKKYK